jgi:ubiquinone/menaquinone biosynthesis C-methylase UbiE
MDSRQISSFKELFKKHKYLYLKNYLYNYLLRKRAVEKCFSHDHPDLILEIGSGISPLVINYHRIVYSDVSFEAIQALKRDHGRGYYVVADGAHLPFKANTFSHIICSEVLEHIKNDRQALAESRRSLSKPHGCLIITVPHRKCYFGYDDRYVRHYRRYELTEIRERLQSAGLEPKLIQKVLGPLEKITMLAVVLLFSIINRDKHGEMALSKPSAVRLTDLSILIFRWMNQFYKGFVWLDAKLMPLSFATVVLIKSAIPEQGCHDNEKGKFYIDR